MITTTKNRGTASSGAPEAGATAKRPKVTKKQNHSPVKTSPCSGEKKEKSRNRTKFKKPAKSAVRGIAGEKVSNNPQSAAASFLNGIQPACLEKSPQPSEIAQPLQLSGIELIKQRPDPTEPAPLVLLPRSDTQDALASQTPHELQRFDLGRAADACLGALRTALTLGWNWLRERLKSQQSKKRLHVCESVSLGEKRFVAVIQVDGEQFLVGGSSSSISTLAHLGRPQEFPEVFRGRYRQDVSPA